MVGKTSLAEADGGGYAWDSHWTSSGVLPGRGTCYTLLARTVARASQAG